jgi:ribonuclease E
MLDHEPDATNQPLTSTTDPADAPPPTRRRRAAVRAAGPPGGTEGAPVIESVSSDAEPSIEESSAPALAGGDGAPAQLPDPTANQSPVPQAAAKRARTTSSAKKTAAKKTSKQAVQPADQDAAPTTRAPRKRSAKKAVAAAPDGTSPASVLAETPHLDKPADLPPESMVTEEQAPVDVLASPAAEQPSGEQVPVDVQASPAAEQPSSESTDGRDGEKEQITDAQEDIDLGDQPGALDDSVGDIEQGADEASDDEAGAAGDEPTRRRRRRRGGRRRRRSDDESETEEPHGPDNLELPSGEEIKELTDGLGEPPAAPAADELDAGEESSERDGQRRRRRRRRRRGEDAGASPDDPSDVVVRVRESRRERPSREVTGIEGSTRMEAKRQRRREGREAGRRRPAILSEAEFLARRESVVRRMIIRQRDDLAQIAVLEDDILVEHYVDRDSATSLIGNVYLGRVQNVLPSMEAAFIDIGRGRNAVLYAGEVDWDAFGAEGQGRKVEKVLKSGQTVLVQVSKDPVGTKGARLTNHVSIPGRYLVYAPSGHLSGISRKLPDNERKRLRDILSELVGEASVIVRTAAEGASEEELVRDVNRLQAQWQDIEKKVAAGNAPQLLYGEPDLTVRIVRDLFTEDFSELIIQGNGGMNDAYDSVEAYVSHVAPHLRDRLTRWDSDVDLFAEYRLDEQIAKGLERKVFLPSGGSLIIDRTEAMTVIDVNTGKFTGAGGNLEATVTSNNLEAAEEIVRQLRLRDIGGIIVIDFIDMVLPSNRELLLRRLVECLGRDRTRHQVAEVTSLGLVQMTRKRIGTGLLEAFSTECPVCHGRGLELHDMPVATQRQADGGAREPRAREPRGQNARRKSEPPAVSSLDADDAATANGDSDQKPAGARRGRRSRPSRSQPVEGATASEAPPLEPEAATAG